MNQASLFFEQEAVMEKQRKDEAKSFEPSLGGLKITHFDKIAAILLGRGGHLSVTSGSAGQGAFTLVQGGSP